MISKVLRTVATPGLSGGGLSFLSFFLFLLSPQNFLGKLGVIPWDPGW
jgi:hypothetical protein